MFYTNKEKKWKRISLVAIIFNILATFILLSRLASLSAILVTIFYLLFVRSTSKNYFRQKVLFLLVAIIGFYIIIINYDLSRLFIVINLDVGSIESRGTAALLGLRIFFDNPIFGSGMGRHYLRAYTNKYISYNGIAGLVDPHNLYVMIFSELGITGSVIIFGLLLVLIFHLRKICQKNFRKTAYCIIFTMLLNSMGGSQIMNEISFSIIFWIYMSIFKSDNVKVVNEKKIGVN